MNSDIIAVQALRGSNPEHVELAFNYLYNKYCRLVFLCVYTLVKTKHDAEEITNDTFVRLFKNRANLSEQRNVKYYIITVAKHLAIDFLRKKKPEVLLDNDFVFSCADPVKSKEMECVVDEINKYLKPDETELIINHLVFGEKFQDIAKRSRKPTNSVKTKYFRSINKIRKEVRDDYDKS